MPQTHTAVAAYELNSVYFKCRMMTHGYLWSSWDEQRVAGW